MKERPILFTGEMVRAIIDGRKTQTRRPVKLGKQAGVSPEFHHMDMLQTAVFTDGTRVRSPFGIVGDRLWVRETWGLMAYHDPTDWFHGSIGGMTEDDVAPLYTIEHRANWKLESDNAYWRPSIHMPRWASRIDLEITAVRVERVGYISDFDAYKEGAPSRAGTITGPYCMSYKQGFRDLWQSIYGTWDSNPWVWVYEFRRVKP